MDNTYPSFAEINTNLLTDLKWSIIGDILYFQNLTDEEIGMSLSGITPEYYHHIHPDQIKFIAQ